VAQNLLRIAVPKCLRKSFKASVGGPQDGSIFRHLPLSPFLDRPTEIEFKVGEGKVSVSVQVDKVAKELLRLIVLSAIGIHGAVNQSLPVFHQQVFEIALQRVHRLLSDPMMSSRSPAKAGRRHESLANEEKTD